MTEVVDDLADNHEAEQFPALHAFATEHAMQPGENRGLFVRFAPSERRREPPIRSISPASCVCPGRDSNPYVRSYREV